ncbi:MAG: tetratricopeptide repeat-containing sulfotransferase family protein [Planctomycetota bacterium]
MASRRPTQSRTTDPRVSLQQGVAEHRAGRLEKAERLYRHAIKADRQNPEAHHLLASVSFARQRFEDGIKAVQQALALDPNRPASHVLLGNLEFASGRFVRARNAYRRAVELEPRHPGHRFALGLALDRAGDVDGAVRAYEQGLELAPADVRIRVNLGEAQIRVGRSHDAVAVLTRAVELAPRERACWLNLARAARDVGDVDLALSSYARLLELDPADARVLVSRAQVLREAGRIGDAVADLSRAVEVAPDLAEARLTLFATRKQTERNDDLQWLEAAVADPVALGVTEHDARFALAKVLEDLGETEAAFASLHLANRARRARIDFRIEDVQARFERVRAVFDRDRMARLRGMGHRDRTPIFVVGMPRSGTSLVEQILASHSEVSGAGETRWFPEVLEALPGGHPDGFVDPNPEDITKLGRDYVMRLRGSAPDAPRIVDKLPMNFVRLGAIRAALPDAVVIHCTRDPRDTGLSIYRQNFEQDLGFAFDLAEIGRYHRAYESLMAHWRAVLEPGSVLEIGYEELVHDLESQVRRILAACGLAYESACLEFHRTERPVRTASLQQVRQPIYASSVGAWRRHESELGPLIAALRD